MSSEPFREPNEVLARLVAAGVELIHAREPAFGEALNVSPPSIEIASQPPSQIRSMEGRGLWYRIARKFYRTLKGNRQLRPLLERVRHEILTRN